MVSYFSCLSCMDCRHVCWIFWHRLYMQVSLFRWVHGFVKRRHLSGNCCEIPQSSDYVIVLACKFTSFHKVFMYFPLCYFLPGPLDWLCFHVHSDLCCFLLCPRCHIFSLKCQMMCCSSFPSLFVPYEFSPVPFISVSLCFPFCVFLAFTFPVQDRGTECREREVVLELLPS